MQHAAEQPGALAQAGQALAAADGGGRRGGARAVDHLDQQGVGFVPERDTDRGAGSVLVRVGQRLLDDPVRGVAGGRGELPDLAGPGQCDLGARRPGGTGQPFDLADAARLLGFAGGVVPEQADHAAQFAHRADGRLPEHRDGLALTLGQGAVHLQRAGVHGDQRELVAQAVVHVLGDPVPLPEPGLPGDHDALAQQLVVALVQGGQQGPALRPVAGEHGGQHGQQQEAADTDAEQGRQRHVVEVGGQRDGRHQDERDQEDDHRVAGPGDPPAGRPAGDHQQWQPAAEGAAADRRAHQGQAGQPAPEQEEHRRTEADHRERHRSARADRSQPSADHADQQRRQTLPQQGSPSPRSGQRSGHHRSRPAHDPLAHHSCEGRRSPVLTGSRRSSRPGRDQSLDRLAGPGRRLAGPVRYVIRWTVRRACPALALASG
ncbi:hypothetical protein ASC99_34865 [Kitasatospora sp. Root107]|nr:hypothetical protein ASC99_34865 [Kitasatospora sp. Root107]